jgi:hypothetical protein
MFFVYDSDEAYGKLVYAVGNLAVYGGQIGDIGDIGYNGMGILTVDSLGRVTEVWEINPTSTDGIMDVVDITRENAYDIANNVNVASVTLRGKIEYDALDKVTWVGVYNGEGVEEAIDDVLTGDSEEEGTLIRQITYTYKGTRRDTRTEIVLDTSLWVNINLSDLSVDDLKDLLNSELSDPEKQALLDYINANDILGLGVDALGDWDALVAAVDDTNIGDVVGAIQAVISAGDIHPLQEEQKIAKWTLNTQTVYYYKSNGAMDYTIRTEYALADSDDYTTTFDDTSRYKDLSLTTGDDITADGQIYQGIPTYQTTTYFQWGRPLYTTVQEIMPPDFASFLTLMQPKLHLSEEALREIYNHLIDAFADAGETFTVVDGDKTYEITFELNASDQLVITVRNQAIGQTPGAVVGTATLSADLTEELADNEKIEDYDWVAGVI